MTLYPIFLDLTGRPVLVVGGGAVAARKVKNLLDSRACVTVVAPHCCCEIGSLAADSAIVLFKREYQPDDVWNKRLVFSAVDCEKVNRQVFQDCRKHNIPCNVADRPGLCDFHVPARLKRGLLQIAVSTGGASPAMAGRIRRQLEDEFGPEYRHLMAGLLELRKNLKSCGPPQQSERQRILENFLDSEAPALLIKNGDPDAFRNAIERWKRPQ